MVSLYCHSLIFHCLVLTVGRELQWSIKSSQNNVTMNHCKLNRDTGDKWDPDLKCAV
jgi:predicted component of type VI protein secretion system